MTYEERAVQSLVTKLQRDARRGAEDLVTNSFNPSTFPHEFSEPIFNIALRDALHDQLMVCDAPTVAATLRQIAADLDDSRAFFDLDEAPEAFAVTAEGA